MSLSNYYVTDQDVRTVSSKKGGERLGQLASTADGRTYAYGLNGTGGGTALSPGKLTQGALAVANHVNQTGKTYAAGTNSLSYAIGNTAITANQYQDGYFYVNAGTGAGQSLLINNTTTPAGNGTVIVGLKDALIAATAVADSKFSLQPNAWSACIIEAHGTAQAIIQTGVPNVSIPDANYGWFQIGGPCSTLSDASVATIGLGVIPSTTTDGSTTVELTSTVSPRVGYTMIAGVSAEYRMVYLTIGD